MSPIRILAIAGSLRLASSNSALVNVAAALPLASVNLIVYSGLAALPPFNPDNDGDSAPEAVRRFRHHLRRPSRMLVLPSGASAGFISMPISAGTRSTLAPCPGSGDRAGHQGVHDAGVPHKLRRPHEPRCRDEFRSRDLHD